ncbi:hypothetical protein [Paraburkholderia sp. RL17-373-BIF-A]|uniref:hypothetical protein n=1 Tax=Paraburkholderia sp. RL17-373-BIF-A TaxID=3031629 RepID=UPI0038BA97D8
MRLFVLLTVSALLTGACGGSSGSGATPTPTYSAVVDAGSSGSRIYLYKSVPSNDFGTIETLLDYTSISIPDLSSYAGNPAQAGPHGVQPLLDQLTQYLRSNHLQEGHVRVSVLGTAGMRSVARGAATAIYDSVTKSISSSHYTVANVGTISGQEEGLYAWASVNHLKNTFQDHATPYGIIEVGGASAQVTYVGKDKGDASVVTKTINGIVYPVFSISYLGLGQNSARASMIESSAAGGGTDNNTCYTSGYSFGSAPGDPSPAPGTRSLTGNYDYATCQSLYRSVIGRFDVANTAVMPGFSGTHFLILGGSVSGVLANWGLSTSMALPNKLLSEAQANCQGATWTKFYATYSAYGPMRFLQPQCANSTYLGTLLYDGDGLGLRPDQGMIPVDVAGRASTWTLGYVLLTEFGT